MKSAVVTGGAGFIGSHLVDALLASGIAVSVIDNLTAGREADLEAHAADPRFRLVAASVEDAPTIERLFLDARPDVVFHLAALHSSPAWDERAGEAVRTNVCGTQSIIDAAAAAGTRRIVFTSTADVYTPAERPHVEEDDVTPFTVYGVTKLAAEQLLRAAYSRQRIPSIAVARLFNTYGSRETNPHVIPDIVRQLRHADRRVCLGNTWPKRDFVYVADVVAALRALATAEEPAILVNVASGRSVSIDELARAVARAAGVEATIVADASRARPVERAYLGASIERARALLNCRPRFSLETGLQELMDGEVVA